MKEIILYNGNVTIVDDDDYEKFAAFKYYENNRGYAYRNGWENKKAYVHYLHRDIINAPKGMIVDHINGNKLDNRKSNLRLATAQQNQFNMRKTSSKRTSKYKGVCWIKTAKAWQATIRMDEKQNKLGYFETEEAAAIAYNEKAKEYQGEFAVLNDVPYDPDWKSKLIPNRRDGVGKSKYRGVSYRPKYNDWQCHIMVNYKSIFLGTYDDELGAAKAYNEAAIKYRGDKAKLNILD